MRLCLADIASPFYDTAKPFRNWSSLPYYQLDLVAPPFVAQNQLAQGIERALVYLQNIHAQGYNGIVIDNLAHLVTFEHAPERIYTSADPEYQRAVIYRSAFAALFECAAKLGMQVFVTADLQWSTPAIRAYVGRMKADNPRLVDVNRWALQELFTYFPHLNGLFIRVGEAGGTHDQHGYQGHMLYTNTAALRSLIDTLLPICEQYQRQLVVRTWSIGIGQLGDLIWSPERYQEVFGAYTSANLLTSIKHGPMDFFRFLPNNPTLGMPGPRQLIEMQNRREYELFGMVPSSVVELHQQILRNAQANPQYAGIWAWNGTGGWGGGHAALGAGGWSSWTELSSALTAAIANNPECSPVSLVHSWCHTRFGEQLGAAVAACYLESGKLIEHGWYFGALAQGVPTLGAIYLPTLLWVWWMRPTASLLIWIYLATALADTDAVLQAGAAAAKRAEWHAQQIMELSEPNGPLTLSVRYFADVLGIAHAIRTTMLQLADAVATRNHNAWHLQAKQAPALFQQLFAYERRWEGNSEFPALELAEIKRFLSALISAPHLIWRRAGFVLRIMKRLKRGRIRRRVYLAGGVGAALMAAMLARKRRRSIGMLGMVASSMFVPAVRKRVLRATFPWLSQRYYLLPSIFFETGPAFTEWSR